jgi:hypothetical protein
MGIRGSPAVVARYLKNIAQRKLPRALYDAERASAKDAMQQAVKASSGPLTSIVLAAKGHPYATRHPQAPPDPAIINKQTGRLAASWQTSAVWMPQHGFWSFIVYNNSPEAKFMAGTRYMVARPLPSLVLGKIAPRRNRRLLAAVRKALK